MENKKNIKMIDEWKNDILSQVKDCKNNELISIEWKNDNRDDSIKVYISEYGVGFCPVCHGSLWQIRIESNYCFRCGQKISW